MCGSPLVHSFTSQAFSLGQPAPPSRDLQLSLLRDLILLDRWRRWPPHTPCATPAPLTGSPCGRPVRAEARARTWPCRTAGRAAFRSCGLNSQPETWLLRAVDSRGPGCPAQGARLPGGRRPSSGCARGWHCILFHGGDISLHNAGDSLGHLPASRVLSPELSLLPLRSASHRQASRGAAEPHVHLRPQGRRAGLSLPRPSRSLSLRDHCYGTVTGSPSPWAFAGPNRGCQVCVAPGPGWQ